MLVSDILLYGLYINWILGAVALAYLGIFDRYTDIKKFWITFVFGLYGFLVYTFDSSR